MINIAHPQVLSKPPLKDLSSGGEKKTINKMKIPRHRYRNAADDSRYSGGMEKNLGNIGGTRDSSDQVKPKDARSEKASQGIKSDCNENLIEPESSSFQQLCNMINDLEMNITNNGERQAQSNPYEVGIPLLAYFDQVHPS